MTEDVVSKQTVKNTIHELEVQQYIYDNYDTEYLENVYIAGDGAPWIVAGCRVLEKSKFVLDQYDNMIWGNIFTRQPHI